MFDYKSLYRKFKNCFKLINTSSLFSNCQTSSSTNSEENNNYESENKMYLAMPYVQQPLVAAVVPQYDTSCVPVNYCCYRQPMLPCGETRYYQIAEPTIIKNIDQHFGTVQTHVRENNHHIQYNRTVVTNVNRHHFHTQRIVTNENNHNTYVTNHVIKVNDIHHQKVEHVPGEKRVFNDFKATQRVEPAKCLNC